MHEKIVSKIGLEEKEETDIQVNILSLRYIVKSLVEMLSRQLGLCINSRNVRICEFTKGV